jgi:hypothetical protein
VPELEIRAATEDDVPLILSLIKTLAGYERLSHEAVATEETLRASLFGERQVDWNEPAIGFYESIGASPVSGWTVYRVTGRALEELAARG